MADLTNMISSHDAKQVAIEQPLQSKVNHLQSAKDVHSIPNQFLKHYQQFTGEPSNAAELWHVPVASERKLGWLSRCGDALAQLIASVIR
jgi:hypothetical protein